MIRSVYVILPDREPFWAEDVSCAINYLPRREPWSYSLEPASMNEMMPMPKTATVRRFIGYGWRVPISTAAADEWGTDSGGVPLIPSGTVMPGWVYGQQGPKCWLDERVRHIYDRRAEQ